MFVLLLPSLLTIYQRLVDNLLQGCWAQQTCYKFFQQLVIVLQFINLSTGCEWQPCSNLTDKITALLQLNCWQACSKPVANTSCWQVVRFLRVCCDELAGWQPYDYSDICLLLPVETNNKSSNKTEELDKGLDHNFYVLIELWEKIVQVLFCIITCRWCEEKNGRKE
jgi:hypothetical protein